MSAKAAPQHKEGEDVTQNRAEVQSRLRADEEARKSGDNRNGDNSCNVQNSRNGSEKEGDCIGEESGDVDEDEVSDVEGNSDDRLQDDEFSPADYIAKYNSGDECQKEDDVHTESRPSQISVHSKA